MFHFFLTPSPTKVALLYAGGYLEADWFNLFLNLTFNILWIDLSDDGNQFLTTCGFAIYDVGSPLVFIFTDDINLINQKKADPEKTGVLYMTPI